jgi:HAD superfamily hydrolase (TIGR01484 family)
MIRSIFLDIEGTITTPGGSAGKSIKSLQSKLQSLEGRGLRIILCSGRDMQYIQEFKKRWRLLVSSPIIAENGCVIFDGKSEMITFDQSQLDPYMVGNKFSDTSLPEIAELDPAKKYMVTIYPKGFVAGLQARLEDVTKILEYTIPILADLELTITHSSCSVDIQPKGVDKLHGLKTLIQHIPSINLQQSMYIGDSKNDLEVGKYVRDGGGLFCVPENALAELKSIANYSAGKAYDEGVLEIIERFDIK